MGDEGEERKRTKERGEGKEGEVWCRLRGENEGEVWGESMRNAKVNDVGSKRGSSRRRKREGGKSRGQKRTS
jgi:hypothetical protein